MSAGSGRATAARKSVEGEERALRSNFTWAAMGYASEFKRRLLRAALENHTLRARIVSGVAERVVRNNLEDTRREIARCIAGEVVTEVKGMEPLAASRSLLERLLVSGITQALVQAPSPLNHPIMHSQNRDIRSALAKAEEKLNRALNLSVDNDDDDDDLSHPRANLPNLKYAKPKYKNMESVLKYIESDDGRSGGVKLVIMNFND